jgi:hypothetical protein
MSYPSKQKKSLGIAVICIALMLSVHSLRADDGAIVQDESDVANANLQQPAIRNAGFDELHVNTATDFSRYRTVLIEDAPVSFVTRWANVHRNVVSNRDIARLRKEMADVLKEELTEKLSADGRYRIVEEAEVDTLLIKPEIIDLNVAAPGSGQHTKLVDSAGYATLSLEMVDAFSGLPAVQLLDRKEARGSGREYFMGNRSNNAREFRRMMAGWAERVRSQLDLLDVPRDAESPPS